MIDLKTLNHEEKRAMDELETRMKAIIGPDLLGDISLYYRFLKARDFDVDKAEKMLRKHLDWRKANQVNTILEDFKPKEYFCKYPEPSILGFDKEGDRIIYLPSGKIEGRDIVKCTTLNELLKHWIWFSEKLRAEKLPLIDKDNKTIPQVYAIMNLDTLTFANATNKSSIEVCLRPFRMLQDNYPEEMKTICVINAPGYYVFIYSILKTLMSNAMIRKVFVFGKNGWKEKLLGDIDTDVLPAFLGGNRTDPDGNPLCKTFVTHGGKIDSCYYLSKEDRCFKDATRVTKVVVPTSGKKEVHVDVMIEGSLIQWEYLVQNNDIGFGLFYEGSEELIELLPMQRYDTSDGVERGSYRAKTVGKYIITFDNTYSWLSSKEIEYCVNVTHTSTLKNRKICSPSFLNETLTIKNI